MNLLQSLYCNQYLDLKKQGKEYAANKNGNIIVTVALLCNVLTMFFLLAFLSNVFADVMGDTVRNFFGGSSGKTIGRLIAIILMLIIYPVVTNTVGKKENYDSTIAEFEVLPAEEQKAVAKRGLIYFFGSIGAAIVIGLLLAL